MYRSSSGWVLFVISITSFLSITDSLTLEEELTLNSNQKSALDQFKVRIVQSNMTFTKPYMVYDLWLLKWLRATEFNVENTYGMLTKAMEWRKRNKMDNILQEKFPYFEENYPFWTDGQDYTGRPVGSIDVSAWDIRKALIAGKGEEGLRYFVRNVELGIKLIYDAIQNGYNVTQGSMIVNMDGFNIAQQGCIQCIPFYARCVLEFERNYPGGFHRIYLINAPAALDYLIRIILPLASYETTESVKIFGTNRDVWKAAILNEIPGSTLRPQFGGTKSYFDFD